jgi:SpoVK/Ycf46/Vps4 family AAA+-type ATPase
MARADQMKALLKAHASKDDDHFYVVAMQMAADEALRGHVRLAAEIRDLIDQAKVQASPARATPIPLAQPKGELSELLTIQYPHEHFNQMVLSDSVAGKLQRVLKEQRHGAQLRAHGLSPRRKVLLVGPPGTGKTMTAAVLAGELRLPLFTARFDSLITKFMGESSAKLRLVFDAIKSIKGVYFFDEFDSLGLQRGSQNDVAEMRRTLNMFLQLIEQDSSDSLILAATNHAKDLDIALFRRFDDIIRYDGPDESQIEVLLRNKLALYAHKNFDYRALAKYGEGESHADIVRACIDAVKDAVIAGEDKVSFENVVLHLQERASSKPL